MGDPYPLYRELREHDPVHFSASYRSWFVARYDDVLALLRDPRLATQDEAFYVGRVPPEAREAVRPLAASAQRWMLLQNPPNHTRLRALCAKAFTPRMVEGLRGRVTARVDELLDAMVDSGQLDIIAALADPLPTIVIAEMLGAPPADHHLFKAWSDPIAAFFGNGPDAPGHWRAAAEAWSETSAYFARLAAERRRTPADDLVSALVAANERGDVLDDDELLSNLILLLFAGHETTTNLIGNGVLALLRDPSALGALRERPLLIGSAVEELLRFDSPVQSTARTASVDLEVRGRHIRAGERVALLLGSANRDPAAFDDPDRLDLARDPCRHVAFGQGIHFCLGAPLARLEGQIAIGKLISRFERLALATDEVRWRDSGGAFRGLEALPVTI